MISWQMLCQPSPVHNNHAAHTMQDESGRNSITEYSQMSELLYYIERSVIMNLVTPHTCGYVCFQLFDAIAGNPGMQIRELVGGRPHPRTQAEPVVLTHAQGRGVCTLHTLLEWNSPGKYTRPRIPLDIVRQPFPIFQQKLRDTFSRPPLVIPW